MPRYKITIEYDGTNYCGWQKQDDQPSVQESIATAVLKFCGQEVDVVGAGRTDAGVHATAQVAHIDLPKEMTPFQVMQGINYYLFNSFDENGKAHETTHNKISILSAEPVNNDFSARFSATKRHYLYRIINRRSRLAIESGRAWQVVDTLDAEAMHKAAQLLVGHHDFTSFRDTRCQSKSPEKTLEQLDVKRYGDEIRVFASARSFLHHQVRIMVGTLAMVGKGKWEPEDILKALNARDRAKGGPTAPPDGLYLVKVDY